MGRGTRHGIIDVGSNAIRMRIVELHADHTETLRTDRRPVRLGTGVFTTGRIDAPLQQAVEAAFQNFQAAFDAHEVAHVTAVATSATREAANHPELVQRIRDAVGIDLEVISGTEEADLLAAAMRARVDADDGASVWLDLGAGSVEVVATDGDTVRGASYKLGALRLLEESIGPGPDHGPTFIPAIEACVRRFADDIRTLLPPTPVLRFGAAGGSLEYLEDLVRAADEGLDRDGVRAMSMATLEAWETRLAALPREARMTAFDLAADRADTIVPAATVTRTIGSIVGATEVLVPRVGLVDGLIAQLRSGRR